jgi:serine/threonine-protein kinase PknG
MSAGIQRRIKMDSTRCNRTGCTGIIEDGYCNVCGMAAIKNQDISLLKNAVTKSSGSIPTGATSSPLTNRSSKGSRRTTTSTSARSSRRQLGAGLVSIPELPSTEPEKAILLDPKVPENKRFCSNCDNSLKREKGFCPKCGKKYSFIPSLNPGDLIVNQYEVKGAIAYGGLGWIYLGFDKTLSRYVVLKGLLNTEDEASAAVAVAERQFLASVKHANIVGIYTFVNHGTEGFIIMEYVGGKTLKEIRKSRGPLPVTEAIAYIHRILSAFAYLHSLGLVYCDFKPDNVMLESNDVKLIDLGGVRRINDLEGDIYGTVGYSAPEAGEGPTFASDLFTIGRTLVVLIMDIPGFSKDHLYSLPTPQEEPLFIQQESLYRFLVKATAQNPDDRFQSADEMAEQLLGILREVVAVETNTPRPAPSSIFGGDMLSLISGNDSKPIQPSYRQLPMPILDNTDPAFNTIVYASVQPDPHKQVANFRQIVEQFPNSKEAVFRLVNSLIDIAAYTEVEQLLSEMEEKDPWEWRVFWYRGKCFLAQGKGKDAEGTFNQVYFDLPGELVAKLAFGLACEISHNYPVAIKMYDIVSKTDPSYTAAAFGLSRCRRTMGDRKGAVEALERVPQTSSLWMRSRVEIARTLIDTKRSKPGTNELKQASEAIDAIALEGMERYQLTKQVLETALELIETKALVPANSISILGQPLEELHLRRGLEKALRDMAHLTTGSEKISLVDEANRVRPKTLF